MNFRRVFFHFYWSCAVSSFGAGMWMRDCDYLSVAFIFLAAAWVYREMDLGWNQEKNTWSFISARRGSK